MHFAIPYWEYGGAAVIGGLADYADIKMKPASSKLTNSELTALGAIGADVFGVANRWPRYAQAVRGGADWGVAMLAAGAVRRHFTAPISVPAATATTPASTGTASFAAGQVGVPASSASAAADVANSTGGY